MGRIKHRFPMPRGARWGDYTIERFVGRGVEGAVYAALGPDGARVALKVPFENPATAIRCALEIDTRHHLATTPGTEAIVNRLIAGSPEIPRFMATPLASAGSLQQWLETHGPLAVDDALAIARTVQERAMWLLQHGLWYFDLRADNMVVEDGDAPLASRLRIVDLGAAVPTYPLLRYERWPYCRAQTLPPRGRGWYYAPFEGEDFFLPYAMLLFHLLTGASAFPVRRLRKVMLGVEKLVLDKLDPRWPTPVRDFLADMLTRGTCATWPGPSLDPATNDSGARAFLASDRAVWRVEDSPALFVDLARAFADTQAFSRIVPVRLPRILHALPELPPTAVIEQIRVQCRFLSDGAVAEEFRPILESIQMTSALARWTPLLFHRLPGVALKPGRDAWRLERQVSELRSILEALASGAAPIVVITICEGRSTELDAFLDAWERAGPPAGVRWIAVHGANESLHTRAPRGMRFTAPKLPL